ncbi:four helix bundle protein [bacterium]|nr:four helix bundle protein [bacterium]
MRDHKELKAWQLSDDYVIKIYSITKQFPSDEKYGLVSQMRRSAMSVPTNIVEGCARSTKQELLRFLDISYGSANELEYQVNVAGRLGYLPKSSREKLEHDIEEIVRVLKALIASLRRK